MESALQDAIAIVSAYGRKDSLGLSILLEPYGKEMAPELFCQILRLTYDFARVIGAEVGVGPDEVLTRVALGSLAAE